MSSPTIPRRSLHPRTQWPVPDQPGVGASLAAGRNCVACYTGPYSALIRVFPSRRSAADTQRAAYPGHLDYR